MNSTDLEPVAVGQPVDQPAVEIGDVTGHTANLGIGDRLDHDVIACPVDANLAHLFSLRRSANSQRRDGDPCAQTLQNVRTP